MALVGVLVLSAMLMALGLALALTVRSDTQLRGALASGVTGFYAAESGLNKGMGEYRNIFMDYNVPNGSDFNPRTLTVGTRNVTYKMTERAGNPQNIVIPSGELFAGLNALQYRYIVNSNAVNKLGDTEAGVGAEFLVGYVPLFQFVAFYANDLEIAPGPQMNLMGRVHTNGNLYLNADAGPLNIQDNPAVGVLTVQVTAAGKIYRGRKRSASECTGNVWVDMLEDKNPKDNNLDAKELTCNGGATREVPASELALWKGSMIANLGNIAIPSPGIIKPPTSVSNGGAADPGPYWEKADLRIVLHLNRPGQLVAAGPILPHSIDAVQLSGAQDVAKTNALLQFMRDAQWNSGAVAGRGPSSFPGTMPIFYTDVPTAASGCTDANPGCNQNQNGASYNPVIPALLPGNVLNPARRSAGAGAGPWGLSGTYMELMGQALGQFDNDYRRGGFYNWREAKWMMLLNINVRDLILWNSQNGNPFGLGTQAAPDTSEGGLVIFVTIDGPSSNAVNNYGIRVFGSASMPVPPLPAGIGANADPTGVTIVSDQALYVLGNFNSVGNRQPSSLVGDSVNILSQNYWTTQAACNTVFCRDGQSVQALANRVAANTTINAAFLGGVDNTPLNGGTANYNGGLENYPRFHETWAGGRTLTYQGAFVSLGTPAHVSGKWCGTGAGCNIYDPPTRVWNFDPAYNDAANLPPLTPRFVYVQQVLFTEDFK
jgi:hypothetical protein